MTDELKKPTSHHHHIHHHHHHHHHDPSLVTNHKAKIKAIKQLQRIINIRLANALERWKSSIYTEKERIDRAQFHHLSHQVASLLFNVEPGQRTIDQCIIIKQFLPEAFPQLFLDCTHKDKKDNKDKKSTKLNRFLSSKQKRLSSLSTKSRAATMSDDDITILAQSIRLVSFSPGHVLFEQGMKGDVMYGVLSGEINVFVHDFNVHRLQSEEVLTLQQHKRSFGNLVATLYRCDILGELAMSSSTGERSASCVMAGKVPTVMIEISKSVYLKCFSRLRKKIRTRLKYIPFLVGLHFFSDWKSQRLQHLLYPMTEHTYRKSSILVKQDEQPKGMFIVVQGTIGYTYQTQDGNLLDTGVSGRGTIFGYECFVKGDMSATCRETIHVVSSSVLILFLQRSEFGQMKDRFQGTHSKVRMEKELSARNRIRDSFIKSRNEILDSNLGIYIQAHISNGTNPSHFQTFKMKVPTPETHSPRTKLRLSLLPASQRNQSKLYRKILSSTVQRSNGSNGSTSNSVDDGSDYIQLDASSVRATVNDFQSTFQLSKFDLHRIETLQHEIRTGPMPCHRKITGKFDINVQVEQLTQKPTPPKVPRPSKREKDEKIKSKRRRWLKAAKTAKRNSKRKTRKVVDLDEFDIRFDRGVYSSGKLVGTVIMR